MKKLIVCVALSLLLQISSLYLLDSFVFVNSSKFKSEKLKIDKEFTKDINGSIPDDADKVELSYEGKYLTYIKEKNVYIENVKTGKVSEIEMEDNEEIMCYKWLDRRDILAIVEKVKKDGIEKIQLITCNAANASKTFVKEICKYEKNMKVENITTSVLTNVYYIDINKGGSRNIVYRIDRNEDLKKVDINANVLGNMQVIPHEDRLIYEDKSTNKFFVTSPNKQLTFKTNKKLTLLSIDRNDVIYMGELNGDKISSIVYGKISENTSDWKRITLESAIARSDLYFNNESKILINESIDGIVKNITDSDEVKYDGKLIQIKDGFIATANNDGKLKYENYKSKEVM
jgi:hypothetical protein